MLKAYGLGLAVEFFGGRMTGRGNICVCIVTSHQFNR